MLCDLCWLSCLLLVSCATHNTSYGRPPASWPTAIIFYCWCFYHLTYLLYFFRHVISEVSGPIVAKLCYMFGGECNFLNWVKNLGVPPPKKFGGPKTSKFRNLRFDREYLRTGTRYRRSENGVGNCNHSPISTPNLVNFGTQTAKNRALISTHSIDFFGRSYLSSHRFLQRVSIAKLCKALY